MTEKDDQEKTVSATRLRIGLVCFVLFWLPFWLLAPIIDRLTGNSNDPSAQHTIFVAVIVIQTIFGILGVVIAGKEVVKVFRHTKYTKAPKVIWHILTSGKMAE